MPENKWKSFFGSRLFLCGAFALTIFLLFVYGRAYYQDFQIQEEIKRMRDEVARLEIKKMESLEVLKYVKTPAFLEARARTEFNLVKPGEKVAVINKNAAAPADRQTEIKVVESDNMPIFLRWWRYFFKN